MTATDTVGNTATASVVVTAEAVEDYVRILAIPESGVSPLEVDLKVDGSFTITDSSVSYGGPGSVEFLETGEDEYRVRMETPGIYYFIAEVEKEGVTYSDTVAVMVVDQSVLDDRLKAVFNSVKTALAAGDIEGAVSAFTSRSRERYREAFNELSGNLQQITSDMQDIELIYVHADVAKYRITRPQEIDGEMVDLTYYIYFRVDMDGMWKIELF